MTFTNNALSQPSAIISHEESINLVASYPRLPITVDCVIFGFEENELKVLLIRSDLALYKGLWSLLGDNLLAEEELDSAASRILKQRTGMHEVYLEQVKAFSKNDRHPGGRVITVAYCSLLNIQHHQLKIHDHELHWHKVSALQEMAFDHMQILTTCHQWLQKRMQEHPLGLKLLPEKFSLRELQHLYEAVYGISFDRRNFRKKIAAMELLTDLGEVEQNVHHRPGKLYRFDFDKYVPGKHKWSGIDF